MSEPRKRRQFLADALFAGGALSVAAFGARHFLRAPESEEADASPTPEPHTPTPSASPVDAEPPHLGGAVCPPKETPVPQITPGTAGSP